MSFIEYILILANVLPLCNRKEAEVSEVGVVKEVKQRSMKFFAAAKHGFAN
jgi:hypothetical protein